MTSTVTSPRFSIWPPRYSPASPTRDVQTVITVTARCTSMRATRESVAWRAGSDSD